MIDLVQAGLFDKSIVGTDEQRANLMKQIDSIRHQPDSSELSNDGCWRSYHKYRADWLLDAVTELAREATEFYLPKDPVFARLCKQRQFTINYWTNINQPNSRNLLHTHYISHFTAVYYVQGTDTGDLRMINPANILNAHMVGGPFIRDYYFKPSDGDLILFPSWIPHEVLPNHSDRERINIAFDITVR